MSANRKVPLRGSCAEGHVVTTEVDYPKLTWSGSCPHDGCGKPVRCRRINDKPPADAPATAVPKAPRRVRKVTSYVEDTPDPAAFADPADGPGGAGGGGSAGVPGAGGPAAEPAPAPGGPDPAGRPAGWRQRLTGARRRAGGSAASTSLYDGIY